MGMPSLSPLSSIGEKLLSARGEYYLELLALSALKWEHRCIIKKIVAMIIYYFKIFFYKFSTYRDEIALNVE